MTHTRHGNTIVLVASMVVLVASLLFTLSQNLEGRQKMVNLRFAQAQARNAAEAIGALREKALTDILTSNDFGRLQANPDSGALNDPWIGIRWFGNCLVRWRIEPIRVAGPTLDSWTANPPTSLADWVTLRNQPGYIQNDTAYHFRIVSEAHTLPPNSPFETMSIAEMQAGELLPWQAQGERLAAAQSIRHVQLALNSLFRYAIFYAPTGSDGDLELHPGPDMDIGGAVHSNGRIFWNLTYGNTDIGTANDPVTVTTVGGLFSFHKYYFMREYLIDDPTMDPMEVPLSFQNNTSRVHRINDIRFTNQRDSRNFDTMQATWNGFVSDGINGGVSVVQTLANIPELAGRPFEHARLWPAGTPVYTGDPANRANISAWTVLPGLPQAGVGVYFSDPANGNYQLSTTPYPDRTVPVSYSAQLFYTADPSLNNSYPGTAFNQAALTIDVDANQDGWLDNNTSIRTRFPVDAQELRQYRQRDNSTWLSYPDTLGGGLVIDCIDRSETAFNASNGWQYNLPIMPTNAATQAAAPTLDTDGDTFSDAEMPGQYLAWALDGRNGEPTRGLIIRERTAQDLSTTWNGMPNRPGPALYSSQVQLGSTATADGTVLDYVTYLASQYVVLFGREDITTAFFTWASAGVNTPRNLICYEDDIIDRRDATCLQYHLFDYSSDISALPPPITQTNYWSFPGYRVNTLSINIAVMGDFLRNYDGDIDGDGTRDANCPTTLWEALRDGQRLGPDLFSGMLYVHRTRRSEGMTPWNSPRWDNRLADLWVTGRSDNYSLPVGAERCGDGPAFAFTNAVRLVNAATIETGNAYVDNGGTPSNTSDDYSRPEWGLTVVTPNRLYIQGDYNTFPYQDSDNQEYLPACALFADQVNMLSNAWQDAAQATAAMQNARTTTLNASVITNNVPSYLDPAQSGINDQIVLSFGVHNLIRFNERWTNVTWRFSGSIVMMNRARYTRGSGGNDQKPQTEWQDLYDPPTRDLNMNPDLFTSPGQPPFTPYTTEVTRSSNQLVHLSNF